LAFRPGNSQKAGRFGKQDNPAEQDNSALFLSRFFLTIDKAFFE
jgi:hypothetical protein